MIYGPDLTMHHTTKRWKSIASRTIRDNFYKRKLLKGNLFYSIAINILSSSGGDVEKVQFIFEGYGRFVDMGVGRGWPIGGRREAALNKAAGFKSNKPRSRKQFYTKNIFHQGHRLHEILYDQYKIKLLTSFETILPGGNINIPI